MMEDQLGRAGTAPAWAWIVADGTGVWVFGAATGGPANAWALGVACSDAQTIEQLRSLEAVRDSGRIVSLPASLGLFEAWKAKRSQFRCRVFQGTAVTAEEHERLTGTAVPLVPELVLRSVPLHSARMQ